MHRLEDLGDHPRRAAEALQLSLDATNPRVRTIQREIARGYAQLAAIPNDIPAGAFTLESNPCDAAPTVAAGPQASRWREGRAAAAASRGGCDWENEGGAPRHVIAGRAT